MIDIKNQLKLSVYRFSLIIIDYHRLISIFFEYLIPGSYFQRNAPCEAERTSRVYVRGYIVEAYTQKKFRGKSDLL